MGETREVGMLIILAPLLTVIALITGGIASAVAYVLNGPRRLRRRVPPPLIVMPPVPSPDLRPADRAAL